VTPGPATLAAVVLAAGRGERLRPLTDRTPKPLLTVGDSTLLDAALARVAEVLPLSPADVAVNAHWLADQIVAAVGGRAHVSVEQPEALGTAGAVGNLADWLAGRDVLIANGDVWFDGPVDLRGFVAGWDRSRPRLLVVDHPDRADFDGRWRFAGISLLPAAAAAALAPTPSGLYEVVWSKQPVDLVPTDASYVDCGSPADLETARRLAAVSSPASGRPGRC
jgi:MurNAc alpha-1-phosphate uridylyltransferase